MKDPIAAHEMLRHLNCAAKFWDPLRQDDLENPKTRYRIEGDGGASSLLGEGSYGKVYQAIDKITRQPVAIKEISK